MLRRIAKYIVDRATIESDRLLGQVHRLLAELEAATAPPGPAEVPAAKPEPAAPASRWTSTAYHVEVLGSSVCPDCEQPKKVGAYRCTTCHEQAAQA